MRPRVVISGSGFGGLYAAPALERSREAGRAVRLSDMVAPFDSAYLRPSQRT